MALPAQIGKSATFYEELRAVLQGLVDDGTIAGGDTVSTTLTTLATERDDQ